MGHSVNVNAGTIMDTSASPADWSAPDSDDRKEAGLNSRIRIEKVRSDRIGQSGWQLYRALRRRRSQAAPFLQLPSYKALL